MSGFLSVRDTEQMHRGPPAASSSSPARELRQGAEWRVESAECRTQSAECRVQSAERRVQSGECRVESAERRVQNAECRMQSTEHRAQSAECRVQSAERRVQNAECRVESAERRVQSAEWGFDMAVAVPAPNPRPSTPNCSIRVLGVLEEGRRGVWGRPGVGNPGNATPCSEDKEGGEGDSKRRAGHARVVPDRLMARQLGH